MNDNTIIKIIKTIGILLIFLIGSIFGAEFADNNWKKDILKSSDTNILFSFEKNNEIYYFNISEIKNPYYINHNFNMPFNITKIP